MESLQNVNITVELEIGNNIGGLTLANIPLGYNGTRIICSATLSASQVKATQHSVLLLQGTSNVTNLGG